MKLSCVLLDDDPLVLDLLQAYAALTEVLTVKAAFSDPVAAHAYLLREPTQVLFSDVTMPHLNGLDLVRSLRQPPLVVLMTSFPQYAMEGFNLDVADFLLKPITLDRFLRAVHKVAGLLGAWRNDTHTTNSAESNSFFIRTDSQFVRLQYDKVLYAEAHKDFTKIHTTDGRAHLTLVNLKNLEEQFPAGQFVRTHRSYLVNAALIDSVSNQEVCVGTQAVPLGHTYRDRVTQRLVNRTLIRRQH